MSQVLQSQALQTTSMRCCFCAQRRSLFSFLLQSKLITKGEESNGIIAMMDGLIKEFDKEMTEAEVTEKDAQGDYEQFTRDAAEKRVQDSKSITETEGAKAEAEVNLVKETKERQTKMKEDLATVNCIEGLHKDCDWLVKNYDVRKSARTGEVDALTKAKAVLSGADFSLVQTNSKILRVRK